jgi:hypothetical protein
MAHQRPVASTASLEFRSIPETGPAGNPATLAPSRRLMRELRDWLMVAWVLWWSWAYVQGALAHRFPHLLGWTRTLW